MNRVYTDKELMIATQLAYCNWDDAILEMEKKKEPDNSICGLLNIYANPCRSHQAVRYRIVRP